VRRADTSNDFDLVEWGLSACCGLYPDATVCLLILRGFTSWSSVREPTQVFTLLETLYGAFDAIAKSEVFSKRRSAIHMLPWWVFPPRKDHTVVMVRFASDCRDAMMIVTRKLEVTLGPDTGNLELRFGLHSGPVTAGVLRGEITLPAFGILLIQRHA
jgi:class 3 adenylate cyclase